MDTTAEENKALVRQPRRQLRWYLPSYNRERLHSGLGYQSPVDHERRAA